MTFECWPFLVVVSIISCNFAIGKIIQKLQYYETRKNHLQNAQDYHKSS